MPENPEMPKSKDSTPSGIETFGMIAAISGGIMCFMDSGHFNLLGVGLLPGGMCMVAVGNAARWIIALQITVASKVS